MNNKIVKLIAVVVLLIGANNQGFAQAPDCDQCDQYLEDDPIAYAECVEEFCSDSIPIDNNIWILMIGGLGMGAYALYKYSGFNMKTSGAGVSGE